MFHSMTGSSVPVVLGGGALGTVVVDEPPAAMVAESKLKPPVSDSTVICCVPAPSVAVNETVVQFCQPPVDGTVTACQTLLDVLKPTWTRPPPGDATRSCTV